MPNKSKDKKQPDLEALLVAYKINKITLDEAMRFINHHYKPSK